MADSAAGQHLGLRGDLLIIDARKVRALAGLLERKGAQVATRIQVDLRIVIEVARFGDRRLADSTYRVSVSWKYRIFTAQNLDLAIGEHYYAQPAPARFSYSRPPADPTIRL